MKPEPQELYTTPLKKLCLYTTKYLSYEDDNGTKNWQLFEEGTDEEYWLPENQIQEVPKCTNCNTPLKVVITTKGKFWGCRNHKDGCTAYIPIEQYGMTKEQEGFFNRVIEIEGIPSSAEEAQRMSQGWKYGS